MYNSNKSNDLYIVEEDGKVLPLQRVDAIFSMLELLVAEKQNTL